MSAGMQAVTAGQALAVGSHVGLQPLALHTGRYSSELIV